MKTARLLKKFVEDAGEGKYQDAEIQTLQLWVGKKRRVWYFIKKYKFRQYRTAIGPYPAVTRDMAIDQCNIFMANLLTFGELSQKQEKPDAQYTVKEAFDVYVSQKSYCRKYWKYIQVFSNREISGISREEIQTLHQQIKAPSMANHTIRALRAAINIAIREGRYQGNNPAEKKSA